jgi:hypothetical protein
VVDRRDAVGRGVPFLGRQIRSQNRIIEGVDVHRNGVVALVIVPDLGGVLHRQFTEFPGSISAEFFRDVVARETE